MHFFSETSRNITTSTPLGSWNLAGYQQVNLHAWAKGGAGKVYMEIYFNNLSAYHEELVIGGVGPGGWGIVTLAKTFPIHAPTMSVVLYNPTGPVDFKLRLYSACCESRSGLVTRLLPGKAAVEGDAHRKLSQPIDLEALARVSDPSRAGMIGKLKSGRQAKTKSSG